MPQNLQEEVDASSDCQTEGQEFVTEAQFEQSLLEQEDVPFCPPSQIGFSFSSVLSFLKNNSVIKGFVFS